MNALLPPQAAEVAGLRYVNGAGAGIRRSLGGGASSSGTGAGK